ncbi:hypothetical protein BO70DRAFT_426449 [Aspergillus heteromorphus CBS 117.55]|uniref:Uncharacterized protein n=1 Tax=Aspergillus heteromorphus CBS 117.55 TaxID=1448321 RepID=A0A317WUM7_9EURO|nr:uncharacterized protein BO70DRAFT_426449 [Aspergillus heteromorphus CBS 117.55]PWY90056.1 hypothetical protein BO70DRAFT_426449 [Aspergillus heteromorphus CBS 117.55]
MSAFLSSNSSEEVSPQGPSADTSDVRGREVGIAHSDSMEASSGTKPILSSPHAIHKPSSSPNLSSRIGRARPREQRTPVSQAAMQRSDNTFVSRIPRGYSPQQAVGISPYARRAHASEPRSAIPIATYRRSMMNLGGSQGTPVGGSPGGDRVAGASRTPRSQPPAKKANPDTPIPESVRRAPEEQKKLVPESSADVNGSSSEDEPIVPPTIYTGEYRIPLAERIRKLPYGPTLRISPSAEELIMGRKAVSEYDVAQRARPAQESGGQGDTSGSSQSTPVPKYNEPRVPKHNEPRATAQKPVTRDLSRLRIPQEATPRCEIARRKPVLPRRSVHRPQLSAKAPTSTGNENSPPASLATTMSEICLQTAESARATDRFPPRSSSMQAVPELAALGEADEQKSHGRSRNTTFDDIIPQGAAESHNGKPQDDTRAPTPFSNLRPFRIRDIFHKNREVAGDRTVSTVKPTEEEGIPGDLVKKTLTSKAKQPGASWTLSRPRTPKTSLGPISSPIPLVGRSPFDRMDMGAPDTPTPEHARQAVSTQTKAAKPGLLARRDHTIFTATSGSLLPASVMGSPESRTAATRHATVRDAAIQTEPPRQDSGLASHVQFDAIISATCDKVRGAEGPAERVRYLRLALGMQRQVDNLRRSEQAVHDATAELNEKVAYKAAVENAIWARSRQIQAMMEEESEGRR